MEEEVEYAGQREDFLSEDDHSPTDASEDSVEVKVTPIKTHYRHSSPLSRPPSAAHHHHHHLLPSSPFKGATIAAAAAHHHHHHRPRSPPTHKFYHNFRKHAHAAAAVVAVDPCKERRSPPEDYEFGSSRGGSPPPLPAYYDEIKHSPQDFSTTTASTTGRASPRVISPPIPASNAHARPAPSPPASPLEPPTGAAPWSPGTRGAAAARSRRKPAEPRRLCHEGNNNHHNNNNNNNISSNNNKRCHSPDAPHRKSAKVARTDGSGVGGVSVSDDKSVGSSPSPGAPPLLAHHPLLGPLARPPMGAFPPLLLPPAWPPAVAAQWGYPRVVTPLGWAGLTPGLTPHPYPMLLPHHYPLGRPLIHPHLHPASPPSPKSPPPPPPPPRPPSEEQVKEELPIPLVTKVTHPDPPLSSSSTSSSTTHHLHHHHHHHAHHPLHSHPHPHPITREVSVVKKIGKAPSKFLSVESLIASDSSSTSSPSSRCPRPSETVRSATSSAPKTSAPAPAPAAEVDDELLLQTSAGVVGGDDDDTIHTLLQPNKQKQRNYKNMTRERRIEANARERNRVHTISAAFEKLRTSVPAYSHNQKLSKLSVLRIACSYILLLSRLAGHDYSEGGTEPSLGECVDLTTRTIQVEGKAKKKRDE